MNLQTLITWAKSKILWAQIVSIIGLIAWNMQWFNTGIEPAVWLFIVTISTLILERVWTIGNNIVLFWTNIAGLLVAAIDLISDGALFGSANAIVLGILTSVNMIIRLFFIPAPTDENRAKAERKKL